MSGKADVCSYASKQIGQSSKALVFSGAEIDGRAI